MKIATILWTLLMGYFVLSPYFDDGFREGVETSTATAAAAGLGIFILVAIWVIGVVVIYVLGKIFGGKKTK